VIPLRDSTRSNTVPFVTVSLIVINVLVFLGEASLGRHAQAFIMTYGFVPARLSLALEGRGEMVPALLPLLTSIFLHGGWLHLIGNMWYLWIFGDNVEDRLGHTRYLLFYLGCGLAAGLTHALSEPAGVIPAVGASGAIAGVLGAYLVFYPRGSVLTLIPFFFFFTTAQIPAVAFLGFWFLMQWLAGTAALGNPGAGGGVAWWAHIGGFAAGLAVGAVISAVKGRRSTERERRGGRS
jgi:membrane associated rhomboid family serine protease